MYMCMIFHKKFFQCVTEPIPLFLTPQIIGLLKCHLLQHRFYMICSNHNEYSIFINQNMTSLSFIQYSSGFMIMHLYNYPLYEDGTQITNMYIFRNLKDFQIHFSRFKVLCNMLEKYRGGQSIFYPPKLYRISNFNNIQPTYRNCQVDTLFR